MNQFTVRQAQRKRGVALSQAARDALPTVDTYTVIDPAGHEYWEVYSSREASLLALALNAGANARDVHEIMRHDRILTDYERIALKQFP